MSTIRPTSRELASSAGRRTGSPSINMFGGGPADRGFGPGASFATNSYSQAPATAINRLQTASMRPGSGRNTRGSVAGVGVALSTTPQIASRLTTAGGLTGAQTSGGGRLIADKNFFIGLIRQRNDEVAQEINRMAGELERMEVEASQRPAQEATLANLHKELAKDQELLAAYNLTAQKFRADEDLQEVMVEAQKLKDLNAAQGKKNDAVFTERNRWDTQTKQIESQIEQLLSRAEQRVQTLDGQKRDLYYLLKQENEAYVRDIAQKQEQNSALGRKVTQLERELASDPGKAELAKLQSDKADLEAAREQLQAKDDSGGEKQRLIKQINDTTLENTYLQNEIAKTEQNLARMSQQASGRPAPAPISDDPAQKVQNLLEKERELDGFLNGFEENKRQEIRKLQEIEYRITSLLEHISRGVAMETNLPTVQKFREMQFDLTAKEEQAENSQQTLASLKDEYKKMQADLEKLNTLDVKLDKEIQEAKARMNDLRQQVDDQDPNLIRAKNDAAMRELSHQKQALAMGRNALIQQTQLANAEYEAKQHQLASHDAFAAMENLEKKLVAQEAENQKIKEFIAATSVSGNYGQVVSEARQYLQALNDTLIQQCSNTLAGGMGTMGGMGSMMR